MVLGLKMENKICKTCKLGFRPKKKKQIFCSCKCIRNETQFKKGIYVGFGFKKGHNRKHTEEEKIKISNALKGRQLSQAHKEKLRILRLGEKLSKETIEKLRIIRTGWRLSEETKKKLSELHKGSRNYSWKGGITPLRIKIWHSLGYKLWRKSVFERDNYTRVFCGKKGGRLAADHIKSFRECPELRFSIDNGRTLCEDCHFKTETYGKWK